MIKLRFITTMPEPNQFETLRTSYPGEAMQLFQLVTFWATNYGVRMLPIEISEDGRTKTDTFLIPDDSTRDAVLTHAQDNGVTPLEIFDTMKAHVEAMGGTLERVEEDLPD